jgi:hypothetical protein
MSLIEFLASLTRPNANHEKTSWQRYVWYWPERQLTVASNGYLMATLRGRIGEPRECDPQMVERFRGILEKPWTPFLDTDVAALLDWCAPVEEPREGPCEGCGGDGKCECPRCEKTHDCGDCHGTGRIMAPPDTRPGIFQDAGIWDRNKLARLLVPFSGTVSLAHWQRDMLRVSGSDWSVYMAPLDRDWFDDPAPVFPAKEIPS